MSQNKGTTGQAQNLAMGQDGPGQSVKIWDGTQDWTITTFSVKIKGQDAGQDNHYFLPKFSCFRTSFPVLERTFPVLERSFRF